MRGYSIPPQKYRTIHRSLLATQETVFRVKASSDAMISLLSVPSNLKAPSYEVVIGAANNMKTVLHIRSGTDDLPFEVDTPDILDPEELRPFWASWINGTIQFGKGSVVGQNRLISFPDPKPALRKHVHSIAVASGGEGLSKLPLAGEWEFGDPFDMTGDALFRLLHGQGEILFMNICLANPFVTIFPLSTQILFCQAFDR